MAEGASQAEKRGEPYDTLMRPEPLKINMAPLGEMDPDQNIWITAKKPLNASTQPTYTSTRTNPPTRYGTPSHTA